MNSKLSMSFKKKNNSPGKNFSFYKENEIDPEEKELQVKRFNEFKQRIQNEVI
jgi:hypothetical protein